MITRAWTFQEQQLSPRIIHFATDGILWECREYVAFEDYSALIHRSMTSWVNPRDRMLLPASWRLLDGAVRPATYKSAQREHHDIWLRAVEDYSARSLSHQSDKLPALSGLAAGLGALLDQDAYWAGIWRGDLARSLVWTPRQCASFPSEKILRLSQFPSWSWASYNGAIVFASFRRVLGTDFTLVEEHAQKAATFFHSFEVDDYLV